MYPHNLLQLPVLLDLVGLLVITCWTIYDALEQKLLSLTVQTLVAIWRVVVVRRVLELCVSVRNLA